MNYFTNFLTNQLKRTSLVSAAVVLAAMNMAQAGTTNAEAMKIVSVAREVKAVIGGIVTDNKGAALPGVLVKVKGTNTETSTDAQGRFSINAPDDATLVFSSVGFATQEVAVTGRTSINIQLAESENELSEVVVTALGIERQAKSLSYNTTTISAEDLNAVKTPNVLNSLAGKAAGVFLTQGSNGLGGSPRVVMRGNKSINGTNEPLYVVDGVAMSFSDFNSEDVESMSVLNGSQASVLYGSRGSNGVILITTKKGRAGTTNVDFTSTAQFENPFVLPKIQTEYGQGLGGVGPATNPTYANINDSWGPKITNGSNSRIDDFFQTGQNYINSISVSSGNGPNRLYMSYGNTSLSGMAPENTLMRHNISVRGTSSIFNNKVSVSGGINYINNHSANQPSNGWYNNPVFGLYLFPAGVDMNKYSANGGAVFNTTRSLWLENWPFIKNEHSSNENPYWIQNYQQNDNWGDRTIFNGSAKWDLLNWLNVTYRATYTRNNSVAESRISAGTDPTNASANGNYSKTLNNNNSFYNDVLANISKDLSKSFHLNATAGFTFTNSVNRSINNASTTNAALVFPNFFSVQGIPGNGNFSENLNKEANYSFLGTTQLGWKETLFLDLTFRREKSSTVNDAFSYPSVGLAYVLTQTTGELGPLSFAKLRGSYAQTGNSLALGAANGQPFYSINSDRSVNGTFGSLPYFSGSDTINLKPERTKGFEVGADLRFFKDKLSLNVTYYNQTTYDQVYQIGAPGGSGATNFWINGGTIQNQGVEASASFNTKLSRDVKWNIGANFGANTNRIKSLSNLLTTDRFVLTTGNRLTSLYLLRPGSTLLAGRDYGRFHDLFGRVYVKDASGNYTYVATGANAGLPVVSTNTVGEYVGNANPKFQLALTNQFSYKNWNMSFLIDGKVGGLTSSSTEQWLDYKGLSQRSADARNAGGVTLPNGTKYTDVQRYYGYISAQADNGAVAQEYLWSTTNFRVREIALGYKLPKFSNTIKNVTLTGTVRNAFFIYKKSPFDPDIASGNGNAALGFESFQMPTARQFGLTLRAGF